MMASPPRPDDSAPVVAEQVTPDEQDSAPDDLATVESLLDQIEQPSDTVTLVTHASLRTARIASLDGRRIRITWRGEQRQREARIASDLDMELLEIAVRNRDAVLVELTEGELPLVVGVLQTRVPETLTLRAREVQIEADDEVLIRTGRAGLRLRKDGDVEIVGSRIHAASRGLFRLVGRILRLN